MRSEDRNKEWAVLIICPATGIPASYYAKFADAAGAQGIKAIVIDYETAPKNAKISGMSHWIFKQIPRVISETVEASDGTPVFLIGHSIGGIALSLDPAWQRLHGVIRVAASSGYLWGTRKPLHNFLKLAVFSRLVAFLLGGVPPRFSGLGREMSKNEVFDWARWCSRPGFCHKFHVPADEKLQPEMPVHDIYSEDDPYVTPRTRSDLDRFYNFHSRSEMKLAANLGLGHNRFFHRSSYDLWKPVWDKLAEWSAK